MLGVYARHASPTPSTDDAVLRDASIRKNPLAGGGIAVWRSPDAGPYRVPGRSPRRNGLRTAVLADRSHQLALMVGSDGRTHITGGTPGDDDGRQRSPWTANHPAGPDTSTNRSAGGDWMPNRKPASLPTPRSEPGPSTRVTPSRLPDEPLASPCHPLSRSPLRLGRRVVTEGQLEPRRTIWQIGLTFDPHRTNRRTAA